MKGKALRRALQTSDVVRINAAVPLITDTTELITPQIAQEMLTRNRHNRPIPWNRVEEYAAIMRRGEWKLHAQGIVLDGGGNILTGQTRLWAVVYADTAVYFRVSRGSPPDTAAVLDRGKPQSARDLASRKTEKKHSPVEASIARAICVLRGNTRPSIDAVSAVIVEKEKLFAMTLEESHRTKKTKAVLMILAAIAECTKSLDEARTLVRRTSRLAEKLDDVLGAHPAAACWGKGTAFGIALEQARKIVKES